eukprot:TRINITY_DN2767_c0_g1::TRINITY_DN2767_c0_g1_i2::g.27554::m.27554 TRINITY_DN2767_c0_g1::TRINITY_DN2767_c0_g1_i2::g.27554  ORF type:complete len:239 (-),score=60.90,Amastin/PF07344.6/3.9e-08,PMP22_Claudin/PF00822.15/1.5e-06,PMP22_Claudin/PF00822.15/1.5e+03,Claudin_2/PF13903.1/1.1e-05,DUF4282/PF14110.1/5.6e+03,DUF4282/PF14110.1/0.21,DUF4282/PF14110.1/2.3e+03,SUR7/PF06687.7/2.6e+02,SUR7/PF06687.7/19,SUR7/PF06687.7/15 TRINITY_DN2767_c0_g1_i2:28-675(-)
MLRSKIGNGLIVLFGCASAALSIAGECLNSWAYKKDSYVDGAVYGYWGLWEICTKTEDEFGSQEHCQDWDDDVDDELWNKLQAARAFTIIYILLSVVPVLLAILNLIGKPVGGDKSHLLGAGFSFFHLITGVIGWAAALGMVNYLQDQDFDLEDCADAASSFEGLFACYLAKALYGAEPDAAFKIFVIATGLTFLNTFLFLIAQPSSGSEASPLL